MFLTRFYQISLFKFSCFESSDERTHFKRPIAAALRAQSSQSQLLFFLHAMISPADQMAEQEYSHPLDLSTLEKKYKSN